MPLIYQTSHMRIGVISDTHGQYRRVIDQLFAGVDLIVHAGDIGSVMVLNALGQIAPVVAVMGNTDDSSMIPGVLQNETIQIGDVQIYVIHDLGLMHIDPAEAGYRVVISGHTHMSAAFEKHGALFFNPGSAGPRRFRLPVSVGILTIDENELRHEIIEITV